MEPNHIYQYSLLNALMDGVSESGITASTLLQKGNQGIGTFARMDGELLMLDGRVYQLRAGGDVREAGPTEQIPFAVATTFSAQATRQISLKDKTDIDRALEAFNPKAKNLFLTYRIEGLFSYLKCRTVKGQEYPGQPLSELGKKQSVEEYRDVRGTIVGFRTPGNWQGFGVAGEHLHFISEVDGGKVGGVGREGGVGGQGKEGEGRVGGHVLEVRTRGEGEGDWEGGRKVKMGMATAKDVHVELPTSGDFNEARLVTDDAGVREVEG